MSKVIDLVKLSDKFPPEKIEFRVGATNEQRNGKEIVNRATKGIALAYVTNRAIQDRLDEVCGPENWRNEYREGKGEYQLCGLSIRINDEWITKWDGAENTKMEPIKGGLTSSMKRAAVQWGIGRYLYDVPNSWVDIIPRGKSYIFKEPPVLPPEFLPNGAENKGYIADVAKKEFSELADALNRENERISKEQSNQLAEIILTYCIDTKKIIKWAKKTNPKIKELAELTVSQYRDLLDIYTDSIPEFKLPATKKHVDISDREKNQLDVLNSKLRSKA